MPLHAYYNYGWAYYPKSIPKKLKPKKSDHYFE